MHRCTPFHVALLASLSFAVACDNRLEGAGGLMEERGSSADDGDDSGGDNSGGDNTGGDNNSGGDNSGGDNSGGDNSGGDNSGGDNSGGDNSGGDEGGDVVPSEPLATGSACACDSDCEGTAANPGLCVYGICMQAATSTCATAGASEGCGAGSRCWNLEGAGMCWPDCDAGACAGECDADGSCVPSDASSAACDSSCSDYCTSAGGGGSDDGCPPNSSPEGDTCYCDEGYVVNAAGDGCEPGTSGGGGSCPPNSYLDGDSCYCNEGYVVSEDASACVRECEVDDDCAAGLVCSDDYQCTEPPCTAGSCAAGFLCSESGSCVMDVGSPPAGSPQSCSGIPSWECEGDEAYCGTLTTFNPRLGDGYWDYPLNGESTSDQYRSYARRDVVQLVKYAAASVRCLGETWSTGNGGELGLGDMSEANGDIPGTSDGDPGHPAGTHVDGHDMDIAYFQTGTADNKLRPICEHMSGNYDEYHCVGEPTLLDVWRTAAFIAKLHDSPQLRVIGVDGRVGPMIESAIDQLCASGWLTGVACDGGLQLAYEVTDNGAGWYAFHHHHLHVSLLSRPAAGLGNALVLPPRGKDACLSPDCQLPSLDVDPRRVLYRSLKTRLAE